MIPKSKIPFHNQQYFTPNYCLWSLEDIFPDILATHPNFLKTIEYHEVKCEVLRSYLFDAATSTDLLCVDRILSVVGTVITYKVYYKQFIAVFLERFEDARSFPPQQYPWDQHPVTDSKPAIQCTGPLRLYPQPFPTYKPLRIPPTSIHRQHYSSLFRTRPLSNSTNPNYHHPTVAFPAHHTA